MAYYNSFIGFIAPLYPSLLWNKERNEKTIYLTFDDGPIPEITDFVLDELKKYKVKATFFCVGKNIILNNKQFLRIVAEGHKVGNHTHNHLNGWKSSHQAYMNNINLCEKVINEYNAGAIMATPAKPLFRPPYGKIKRSQIKKLKDKYSIVMWDVLTGDFDPELSPEKCYQECLKHTKPGSIIIFHDSLKASKNMQFVLPRFLEHYTNQGYSFNSL